MMNEATLRAHITGACQRHGLMWHHCRSSGRCQGTPGFPDLIIAGRCGLTFRDLAPDGDLPPTATPPPWLRTIARSAFPWPPEISPAGILRPQDMASGYIDWLLCKLAGL